MALMLFYGASLVNEVCVVAAAAFDTCLIALSFSILRLLLMLEVVMLVIELLSVLPSRRSAFFAFLRRALNVAAAI